MGEHTETRQFDNIAAMADERAQRVIKQICELSEAVAYALDRRSDSA
jgi:hypothetical protein